MATTLGNDYDHIDISDGTDVVRHNLKDTTARNAISGKLDAPSTAGTAGQVLTSDGNGGQSWQTPSGGGSGGTTDYTALTNKPSINSVTLTGNKTLEDLGIAADTLLTNRILFNQTVTYTTGSSASIPCVIAKGTHVRFTVSEVTSEDFKPWFGFLTDPSSEQYQPFRMRSEGSYEFTAERDYTYLSIYSSVSVESMDIVMESIGISDYITKYLDTVTSPVKTITETEMSSSGIVQTPLFVRTGQKVNFLLSNQQTSGSKQAILSLGYTSMPDNYYQTVTVDGPGLYSITAERDYDHVYIWLYGYETTTAIKVQVWVDGTVAKYNNFSLLGDSYNTFSGYVPDGYDVWFPASGNDVTTVENTWWHIFARTYGCALQQNNSFSGAAICNDGYGSGTDDATAFSFITRMELLPQSDLIIIQGGLNDDWAGASLGSYVYSDWTTAQKSQFRPAVAYMLDWLQKHHAGAKLLFVIPDLLGSDYVESITTICEHYGVPTVQTTSAITKVDNHPNVAGMKELCAEIMSAVVDMHP